jgi:hypothetical protein
LSRPQPAASQFNLKLLLQQLATDSTSIQPIGNSTVAGKDMVTKADTAMMVNKLMPVMALLDKCLLNLKKMSLSS